MTNNSSLRIVQISDIHLFADATRSLLGVNTQESFDTVVDLLHADPLKPDLILLTGDLSQDGTEASYQRIAEQLNAFKVPVFCIPGNHDDSDVMKTTYSSNQQISLDKHKIWESWQIILLDSQKPGAVEGYLAQSELLYLEECLRAYPEHKAIVVFHHQPIPVGTVWLDKLGLTNADALWALVGRFPQVETVLFGHVHQEHEGVKNGIRYYSSPSTCIQFKTNNVEFALEELAPGYRWIELTIDGQLQTGVQRAAHYIGQFDKQAKGY
jgi:Icc protein